MTRHFLPEASVNRRQGLSAVEIFVALTLLGAGLSLSASLVVRHARLVAEQRQYRLALDELSNQLELLTALPPDELPAALVRLTASEFAAAHLPEVKLSAEAQPNDLGQQLTLSITWEGRNENAAPLALSAWAVKQGPSPPAPAGRSQP